MATISAANALALADSIANHIINLAALPGSTSAIVTGQGTTLGKVAALNDQAQIFALMDAFQAASANETAYLTNATAYNPILDLFFQVCAALDKHTGGLPAFFAAVPDYVDPHFLDAFNRAAGKAYQYPAAPLPAWQAFGKAIANLGSIAVSGATTGVFTAGSAQAGYGNAPLSLINAGGSNTGASSTVATVTYNKYDASGNLLTGQTATATMPNGSTPGTAVALSGSAAGIAVTNITVTLGNSGDTLGVKSTLLRAVTY